jgi:Fe-S-cluster-containing hydrogenase component 2
MRSLQGHPTVIKIQSAVPTERPKEVLDEAWVRNVVLEAGADDVGFVSIDRPEIQDQREDIHRAMPSTQTLVSFVLRMHRESVRSPQRSLSNVEFHHVGEEIDEIGRKLAHACEQRGIRALNVTMGFPMEADRWPEKMWVVSHKPVAVAAGLGKIGIHRNVIHPVFGNFILLGTVLLDVKVDKESAQLDYNPCLSCKLCVAACPTGAIAPDGNFDFSACYTHNYREFMGGFGDWIESIAASKSALDYRKKVTDAETVSMWQSLSFGANYKAAYCVAVCPAGEDVITPFLEHRKEFLQEILVPLQQKKETIYVAPNSDAEAYVQRRFPHKKVKRISGGLRPDSIHSFLGGMRLTFQRGKAKGLNARYHFTFTGREESLITVFIHESKLEVAEGHIGEPDIRVTADSETWIGFLRKERGLIWAFLRRKIRLQGSPKLLLAFGRCFPS